MEGLILLLTFLAALGSGVMAGLFFAFSAFIMTAFSRLPWAGGIAAMHVAAAHPQYFRSVTAFPGYLWEPTTAKLQALSKICVFMYVGENDEYRWHDEMKREAEFLRSKGDVARYTVEKGQPHRLETLAGDHAARLFEGFEEARKACSS